MCVILSSVVNKQTDRLHVRDMSRHVCVSHLLVISCISTCVSYRRLNICTATIFYAKLAVLFAAFIFGAAFKESCSETCHYFGIDSGEKFNWTCLPSINKNVRLAITHVDW